MLDPDPCVTAWEIIMAPRPTREPRRHWWRELVTQVHRDARDAWAALRESEAYYQFEDEEFLEAHPAPTLKATLIGLSSGKTAPPGWGWHL